MTVSKLGVTTDPRPAGMSEAEWKARCDLAACYQLVDLYGMSDLSATHISVRVPGPQDHFLLNPLGTLFDQITASSLIKVDVEGRLVDGEEKSINRTAFVIHSAVHMARHDLACVLHAHTQANNAVAALKEGLMPLTQKACTVLGVLSYHDWEGPANRLDERERIARDIGEHGRVVILRNHGALTVGRTVGEAFVWLHLFETACRFQMAALASAAGGGHLN